MTYRFACVLTGSTAVHPQICYEKIEVLKLCYLILLFSSTNSVFTKGGGVRAMYLNVAVASNRTLVGVQHLSGCRAHQRVPRGAGVCALVLFPL